MLTVHYAMSLNRDKSQTESQIEVKI